MRITTRRSSEPSTPTASTDDLDVRVVMSKSAGNNLMIANSRPYENTEPQFGGTGAIEPPYSMGWLAMLAEHSSALRPNIDAMATNIDGFGHKLEAVIDIDAASADDVIAQSIALEREFAKGDPSEDASIAALPETPTYEEVQARKVEVREQMAKEKVRVDLFFKNCVRGMPFVAFRRRLRQDLEQLGNAYFEVLRSGNGQIARLVYVPGFTVRLMPMDAELTAVSELQLISPIAYAAVTEQRRLRKYVQVMESVKTFFKELGDRRVVSRKSGQVFPSVEALQQHDPMDGPATELVHLSIFSSRSGYGVPRWIGALLPVLGSRQAEEVNYSYFDNKAVPPLAILVSGGALTAGAMQRLTDGLTSTIKGKNNFHKVLVLDAVPFASAVAGQQNKVNIEIKQLQDSINKDALFQEYDERNMDKVGHQFRIPRLLRGDIRDFNRSTADAALEFTEQQVFAPERSDFDFMINNKILASIGVRFWRFVSLTPVVKDSVKLSGIIRELVVCGVLTPEEGRELATDVFNRSLPTLDAEWTKQPLEMTIAQMRAGASADGGDPTAKGRGQGPRVTATALGHVVTVNEARSAHGLAPWADERGSMSVSAYQASIGRAEDTADVIIAAKARELASIRDALMEAERREAENEHMVEKRAAGLLPPSAVRRMFPPSSVSE